MNKKLITIFALLIVVASISAVSTLDLESLFGSNENKRTNVGGMNFNIPAGFEEDK